MNLQNKFKINRSDFVDLLSALILAMILGGSLSYFLALAKPNGVAIWLTNPSFWGSNVIAAVAALVIVKRIINYEKNSKLDFSSANNLMKSLLSIMLRPSIYMLVLAFFTIAWVLGTTTASSLF